MREAMWDSRLSAWDSHVRDIVPRELVVSNLRAVVGYPAGTVLLEKPNHGGAPRLPSSERNESASGGCARTEYVLRR